MVANKMDFLIITFLIYKEEIETQYFFRKQLYLSVFEDHIFYKKEQILFSDLMGQTLLLRTELGVWQELIDSVKQIHFIIQDRDTFDSLIEMFQLRAFTPNISQQYKMIDKRKHIPIMDDNSFKDYYFSTWPRTKMIYLVL